MDKKEEFIRSIELLHSFHKVQKSFIRLIQKTAANNGLSIPEYTVLMTLMHQDTLIQKEIMEKTFLPKSTLSKAIDRLVHLGLLERQQTPDDRREVEISVSNKGKDCVKSILMQEDGIYQVFYHAVKSLSDEQYRKLMNMHSHIAYHFEAREKECKC